MDALRFQGLGFSAQAESSAAIMAMPAPALGREGWKLTVSPGLIQLTGRSPFRRSSGGGGHTAIREWSRWSRANMVRTVASLDMTRLDAEPGLPAMVTLTLPGDWEIVAPDSETFKSFFTAWRKRYQRAYGRKWRGLWKLEFQRRGAPHLHLYCVVPVEVINGLDFRSWCSAAWADIVNHPDPVERAKHARAGVRTDIMKGMRASDPKRLAVYFGKHSAPGGESDKEYQHIVPEVWVNTGGPGRFWGYIGLEKISATTEIAYEDWVQAKRWLRQIARAQRAVTIPEPKRDMRKPLVDRVIHRVPVRVEVLRSDYSRIEVLDLGVVQVGHRKRVLRSVTRYYRPSRLMQPNQGGFTLHNNAPATATAIARGLVARL
ncbi:hypothetical protein [Mycolicibacterium goodii]|uniref:rolling circle replication-associated protein n=1 Tax=Mycolicibacterium goodii TaxID=134601 RepID=UPI0012FF6D15